MNEIQIFDFHNFKVRTILINNEPYFVGNDVAEILGYSEPRRAVNQHVDESNCKSLSLKAWGDLLPSLWNNKNDFSNKIVINEAGVYDLIFSSKLPSAKDFKRWVTHEVLPAIRKHGAYLTDEKASAILTNKDDLADLLAQASEQLRNKDLVIKEMKPKALFADAVTESRTSILVGDLAKLLKQNGILIGAKRLFQWLRNNHYLINRHGADYNSPTQKSMELGLFEIKESTHINSNGNTVITKTPKVTGKGQVYFVNKFLKKEVI